MRAATLQRGRAAVEALVAAVSWAASMSEATDNELRRVRDYVNSQPPPDDEVTFVQKIGRRKVIGRMHNLYDVRTEMGRWWVIGDPLNLYSQDDFQNVTVALTFHLGLSVMLIERSRKHPGKPTHPYVAGAWRRYKRAVDAFNDADEAEAFQAVGLGCRDVLLALVRDEAKRVTLPNGQTPPKRGDFKGWCGLLLRGIADDRVRGYFTSLADNTWDLTVRLQHDSDATSWDADLVLDATSHFLATYTSLRINDTGERPWRCPRCGSYRYEDASRMAEDESGWITQAACAACGWHDAQAFEPWG